MKIAAVTFMLLVLAGCGFFFGPGYSCTDKSYFAEPPVVVKKGSQYVLRWHYGSMGFYFSPDYAVRKKALVFSLQGTSSSGSLVGREQELLIEGEKALAALREGGAYWWESGGSLVPLTIKEEAIPFSPAQHP